MVRHEYALILNNNPALHVDTDLPCLCHIPVPEDGGEHNAVDSMQELLRGSGRGPSSRWIISRLKSTKKISSLFFITWLSTFYLIILQTLSDQKRKKNVHPGITRSVNPNTEMWIVVVPPTIPEKTQRSLTRIMSVLLGNEKLPFVSMVTIVLSKTKFWANFVRTMRSNGPR